jgi:ribose transport system permease protein
MNRPMDTSSPGQSEEIRSEAIAASPHRSDGTDRRKSRFEVGRILDWQRSHHLLSAGGFWLSLVAMIAVFSILRPSTFLTIGNLKSILENASVLGVLGAGLTIVLLINEFDLSFSSNANLAGAVAILSMSEFHQGAVVAVIIAVLVGLTVGLVNGVLVSYARAPALIITLGVASACDGIGLGLTHSQAIFTGIAPSYVAIGQSDSVFGVPVLILVGVAVVVLTLLVLRLTTFGRKVYAIGGNERAAYFAGVRTRRVRLMVFVILGVAAGIAGVLASSQSAGYYPGGGSAYLLPGFAAVFLGASGFRGRVFNPVGTYVGVLYMGILSGGLVMLGAPLWTTDVLTGAVLIGAVTLAARA